MARPTTSRAAGLLLAPFLLLFLGPSFLSVLRPNGPMVLETPRLAARSSMDRVHVSVLPVVGLAVGCLAARVARRAKGSYNLDMRTPRGEETVMTADEQEEWLATKTAELEEIMPLSDDQFMDEVEELTWGWGRHLLPYSDKRRHETAQHKRKVILKQRKFFKTLRMWHPLALKYPSLLKRLDRAPPSDRENRDYRMNVEYLANEEKIADFTYADFLKETNGLEFNREKWAMPVEGDVVEGTVKAVNEEGAFVEIESSRVKSWAQIPLKYCSLKPVASVEEAGLEVGASIKAAVVNEGAASVVPGDKYAVQYILSLQSLQLDAAWEKMRSCYENEEGFDPFQKVTVLSSAPWGAVVMTEDGMNGVILGRDLGNKAGDPGLVGAILTVRIQELRVDNKDNVNPQLVSEYPIIFSYSSVQKMELGTKYKAGDVADAKIVGFNPASMDIEVEGVPFVVSKVDVTDSRKTWEFLDHFATDEMIKVYCKLSDATNGEIRWSLRALEPAPGAILVNKAKVFENAEETAKSFYEKQQAAESKMMETLDDVLSTDPMDILKDPSDAPAGASVESIVGDDDDDF